MAQRSQATRRVEIISDLPRLKQGPDLGDKYRDGLAPGTLLLGDLKEVQELLADQVAQRLFRAEIFEDGVGSSALRFDEFGGVHDGSPGYRWSATCLLLSFLQGEIESR